MRLRKLDLCAGLLLAGCGARSPLGSDDVDVMGGQGGTLAMGGALVSGGAPVTHGGVATSGGTGSGGRSLAGAPGVGGTAAGGATTGAGGASAGRPGQGGSGSGGRGLGGALGTGGNSGCPALLLPNEDLIDDMEDGDRFILRTGGRVGSWSDANDGTGAMMYPTPELPFFLTKSTNACFSNSVAVKGGPFTDWGANFGFGLGSPYDASAYSGFSFWARIDAGTSATVRIGFPERHTHPDGGLCVANTSCWDTHKARRRLTSDWAKYFVSFSELLQDGWGNLGPFDSSSVFGVTFEIPANGVFSIWVDEVAFVR